jgi:hypothetical protein
MKNQIGIGILDIYKQEMFDQLYNSIDPELQDNVFVTSTTNNSLPNKQTKKYNLDISFAAMRNWLISQMRLKELKYYFLFDSNVLIDDPNFFFKTIKLAQVFGTWMILGPGKNNIPIEDDTNNITLQVSQDLNSSFMFLYSGIVKNNGYFDERYFNTKNLDVLDYIIKLRQKNIYTPNNFHPTVSEGLISISSNIIKKNHIDAFDIFPHDMPKDVQLSYAYFHHNHKYIPGHNDPKSVSEEQLLSSVEFLQKNYANPEL